MSSVPEVSIACVTTRSASFERALKRRDRAIETREAIRVEREADAALLQELEEFERTEEMNYL